MWKSITALAGILVMALMLGGCAGLKQLNNDVSTYSQWPAERKPATYAYERLPSQLRNPEQMQLLEDSAAPALQQAGFSPATDPNAADVVVTLGARVTGYQTYDDPFWWHGGLWPYRYYGRPYWRYGYGYGHGYGYPWGWGSPWGWGYPYYGTPVYEREVAMLIRDRKSGQVLYEVRVTNEGYSPSIQTLLLAMFEAGLKDFPHGGPNPRRVVTQIASS